MDGITTNVLPSFSFPSTFISKKAIIWHGISLWLCESAVLVIPPPSLLPISSLQTSKVVGGVLERKPWHCASTAQQYPNSYAASALLTTDEKHRPHRLLCRKLSPSQPNPVQRQFESCLTPLNFRLFSYKVAWNQTHFYDILIETAQNFHLEFKVIQDTFSLELCDFASGFSVMPWNTETGFFHGVLKVTLFSVTRLSDSVLQVNERKINLNHIPVYLPPKWPWMMFSEETG